MNTYTITLVPIPGTVAPARRLAKLLKIALRQCGLKCVDAREVPADDAQLGAAPAAEAEAMGMERERES